MIAGALDVESFSALLKDGGELADAVVAGFAEASLDAAKRALPVGNCAAPAAVEGPGAASVRMGVAWGMFMPDPVAVGPAEDGVAAFAPTAESGDTGAPGRAALPSGAGSRFGKVKMPVVPSALAGAVAAAPIAPGCDPCASLGASFAAATLVAAAGAGTLVVAGAGATTGGG